MADLSPAYDFDEEEDWTQSFESAESAGKKSLPTINDPKISAGSLNATKDTKSCGHERTIVHFDLDCFYAQVEMLKNPELRLKPLGIQQKNIVVTCNYVARAYGVTKLMFVTDAIKKCPQLVLVSGEDLTEYRQTSYQISEFFKKYTPHVERLGFDENFVDVTELVGWRQEDGDFKSAFSGHEYQSKREKITSKCVCGCEQRIQIGSQVASDMRDALQKELGITSCAGIAHNKVLAKLVAGTHKPNQQTSLLPHLQQDLILSLPSPRSIPGIGSKMSKALQAMGISSVQDLQLADLSVLTKELGPQTATLVSQLSFGVDPSLVVPYSPPQTFSDEDSFKCCNTYKDAEQRIKDLLSSLMKRVVEDGRVPQTVRLSIRKVGKHSNHRESRQTAVPSNAFTQFFATGTTDIAEQRMLPAVLELFKKLIDPTRPFHLTLINICFAKLVDKNPCSNGLSRFFSKQKSNFDTCEQETLTDCRELDNVHTQEAAMNYSNESSGISMPCHSEKGHSVQDNQNVCGAKEKTEKHKPEPQTLKSFFGRMLGKEEHFLVESPSKKRKQNISLLEFKDKSSDSCAATSTLSSSSVDNERDSACAIDNQHSCSQAGHNSETNMAANLESPTEQDPICLPGRLVGERTNKSQDRADEVSGNKSFSEESLKSFLPKGIDAQVLLALPTSLQKEILEQHGIAMSETPNGRHFSLITNPASTRSQVHKSSRKRPLFSPKKSTKIDSTKVGPSTSNQNQSIDTSIQNVKRQLIPKSPLVSSNLNNFSLQNNKAKTESCAETELFAVKNAPNQSSEAFELKPSCPQKYTQSDGPPLPKDSAFKSLDNWQVTTETDASTESIPLPTQVHCTLESPNTDEMQEKAITLEYPTSYQCDHNQNVEFQSSQNSHKSAPATVNQVPKTRLLLPQSVLKKLPKDISPEVFAELPDDIRGELMAHVLMGTPVTVASGASSSGSLNSKKTTTCSLSSSKKPQSNSKSSQKSLLFCEKRQIKVYIPLLKC